MPSRSMVLPANALQKPPQILKTPRKSNTFVPFNSQLPGCSVEHPGLLAVNSKPPTAADRNGGWVGKTSVQITSMCPQALTHQQVMTLTERQGKCGVLMAFPAPSR